MTEAPSTACIDWGDRIRSGRSITPPPIFPNQAEEALAIFKQLKIVDAPGSPTFDEAGAEWVFDIVRSIFGAYDADSGRRLITEWFILTPKKNSKSTLSAGIMMTALILNWRQSAEFAIIAPTVEIASNSYAPASDMVRKDDELEALMHIQSHIKTITNRNSNAFLKVLAADSNTVGGKKSVGTLIDELHLFGKMHGAENMLREALGGLASRPEGFVIYLTTQSDNAPAGVFKQKLQYARDVRDGIIHDPKFVPILFEHPPEMVASKEHLLLENIAMVNPNLGYSVDMEFLEREYTKAKSAGDGSFIGYMAKHANVEIGLALGSDRWAGADFWEKQGRPGLTLESIIERSDVIAAGIDVGQTDDLLGLAVIGRDAETQDWLLWVHAWVHEIALERRKSIAPTLRDFEKQGDLTIYSVYGTDVTEVSRLMQMLEETGKLNNIGCDPYAIEAFVQEMIRLGVPQEKLIGISQGAKMMGSIIAAERALAKGTFLHGDSKMMAWCVGNAKIEPVGNAIKITKQAAGTAKIDPVLAMLNAVHLMSIIPAGNSNSYLNDSEPLYL